MIKYFRRFVYILICKSLYICFYLKGILFFLFNGNKIKAKKNFFILHHSAFGWQVIFAFLMKILIKENENILIINFTSRRNNPALMDFLFMKKNIIEYQSNIKNTLIDYNKISYNALISSLKNFPKIKKKIITIEKLYKILNYENNEVYIWDFQENKLNKYFDYKWLDNLIEKHKINHKDLNQKTLRIAKKIFDIYFGKRALGKNIGSISLRDKVSKYMSDDLRQINNPKNYVHGVKWLIKNKNYIFFNHNPNYDNYFKNIKGVINLSIVKNKLEFYRLNIYIYSINKLFISTHSGSHLVAALFRRKIILGDVWPLSQGVSGKNNIIMPHNIYYKNKKLFLNEIIKNHKNLFFGNVDKELGYEVRPNTKKQIIDLVKQTKKRKILNFPKKSLSYLRDNYYIISKE